jgi:hypothetical protein
VAKINNDASVYVTPIGGFSGWTSKFQYYPNSVDPQTAWNIYEAGWGSGLLGSLLGMYTLNFSVMNNNGDVVTHGTI